MPRTATAAAAELPAPKSLKPKRELPEYSAQKAGKMPHKVGAYTIEFGLVSIPVLLYTAAREEKVERHKYHVECMKPLKQLGDFCPECTGFADVESIAADAPFSDLRLGKDEIVMGCEYGDQVIEISNEELDAMKPASDKSLEVEKCVRAEEVDPIFFESSFYVAPDPKGGSLQRYALFRAAMVAEGLTAIAKIVTSKREHVAHIRPYGEHGMVIFTSYMADEVRPMVFEELPEVGPKELKMAQQLVVELAGKWDPADYVDEYRKNVIALTEAKRNKKAPPKIGRRAVVTAATDLVAAFTASLELAKQQRKARKTA